MLQIVKNEFRWMIPPQVLNTAKTDVLAAAFAVPGVPAVVNAPWTLTSWVASTLVVPLSVAAASSLAQAAPLHVVSSAAAPSSLTPSSGPSCSPARRLASTVAAADFVEPVSSLEAYHSPRQISP